MSVFVPFLLRFRPFMPRQDCLKRPSNQGFSASPLENTD